MDLKLSDDEAELLRALLNTALRETRSEVSNTDNARYRRGLRADEESIRVMLDQLGGPLPNTV